MEFGELLELIRSGKFCGSVCADNRKIRPGDVFVAIAGSHFDGHDFAAEAAEKGAAYIVCQRAVPVEADKIVIVEDSGKSLGILAQAVRGDPAAKLVNLAVTGTNGKTSVCYIVRSIIRAAGRKCGLISTISYDSENGKAVEASLTTPDAITIAKLMAEMVEADVEFMVTEASSHALSQGRLAGIEFAAAAFTNLSGDHLDYHHTPEEYLAEKSKLFINLKADATAVLNKQSDEAHVIAGRTAAKLMWYAVGEEADVRGEIVRMEADRSEYDLAYGGQVRRVVTPMIGRHNISNQLAAAGLCFAAGLDIDTIAKGISSLGKVPGRLEPVDGGQEFAVLVDYAHTDDALKNVLATLRPICKNRLTVVFGCGGDRDRTKRPRMARVAQEYADRVIVTNDNPRTESAERILADIMAGFSGGFVDEVVVEADRGKAIRLAIEGAEKGDIVLLAGKGHETYQIIGSEKTHFDDKQAALDVLKKG